MDLFELAATLALDTSKFESGLTGAGKKASTFGSTLKNGLGTAAKVGAAAVAAVGAATAAVTKKIVDGAGEVAVYGDNIDKMSQKLGMSAEAYQEWDAVMQHSGTSIEAMGPAMKTLSTQAEKGCDAFDKLGISAEQVASLSKEDLFSAVITGLQNMEEGTERTYLASQLLGRGATELGALLNTSAEETQAMKDRVHELGGVMSDEAVKASAAYQDSLQDMQTALDGAKRNMLSEFLPALTSVMDGLTSLFGGDSEGIEQIRTGISNFMDKMNEILPKVIDIGSDIIITLADAIIDSLPTLIEKVPEIIAKLVSALVRSAPKLVTAAVKLVGALARGLVQSIPTIISAGGQLVSGLTGAIGNAVSSAFNWGKDLIDNFTNGIRNFINKPVEAVKSLASRVKSFLGFSEPEEGPLSDFHTYAPDMLKLFAEGIERNAGLITSAVTGAFDLRPAIAETNQGGGREITVPRYSAPAQSRDLTIILEMEKTQFGRAVYKLYNEESRRVGTRITNC